MPRERILQTAEKLLATSEAPAAVTMDDIAAAAGVGKGTLFRAFGSRDGLLDALFAAHLELWRGELLRTGSPIGPEVPPADRIVAILDQLLSFKLENPGLLAARELNSTSLPAAPHYRWTLDLLRGLLAETGMPAPASEYTAHLLLGSLRMDVISALRASGNSIADIRRAVAGTARRILT